MDQISSTEIKHKRLSQSKEALSNNIVDRIVFTICACLTYKLHSHEINIGKIPN